MSRRVRLWLLATVMVLPALMPMATRAAGPNPVQLENNLPGTDQWQLFGTVADDVNNQIKGYASATSVAAGSSIAFYVTVNPVQTYTIDLYRVGWYQGLGGRLMASSGTLLGTPQGRCLPAAGTGLIDCGWTPSYTLSVPAAWTSGIYLARLHNLLGYENYIVFVVRDGRKADFLYQMPVTTYQAYNNYPNDNVTGKSLYEYNSFGANTVAGTPRAVKVSFNRPYADSGVGDFLNWEIDFIRWAEGSGYDVTYSTSLDTHENGGALLNSKGFLSVGHDEYWSKPMRDAVEAARGSAVNLAFFGSNDVFWQIRMEAAGGVPDRTIVCYKDAAIDPVQGATTTVNWRSSPVNQPEQTMLGIQFTAMVDWGKNVDYVVTNSTHPVYNASGFLDGDHVAGLVGYEMDRYMTEYPSATGTGFTLLSHSNFVDYQGRADYANSSIYKAPSGAQVFAAGTMSWAFGLDAYSTLGPGYGPDARIQQTTTNVLNSFAGLTLLGLPLTTTPSTRTAATTSLPRLSLALRPLPRVP